MNRRDFLKLIPTAIVSATVLSRIKPTEKETNTSDIDKMFQMIWNSSEKRIRVLHNPYGVREHVGIITDVNIYSTEEGWRKP